MLTFVKNFLREEEGATMIEYGLMVALIAVALIVAVQALSTSVETTFEATGGAMDAAAGTTP